MRAQIKINPVRTKRATEILWDHRNGEVVECVIIGCVAMSNMIVVTIWRWVEDCQRVTEEKVKTKKKLGVGWWWKEKNVGEIELA